MFSWIPLSSHLFDFVGLELMTDFHLMPAGCCEKYSLWASSAMTSTSVTECPELLLMKWTLSLTGVLWVLGWLGSKCVEVFERSMLLLENDPEVADLLPVVPALPLAVVPEPVELLVDAGQPGNAPVVPQQEHPGGEVVGDMTADGEDLHGTLPLPQEEVQEVVTDVNLEIEAVIEQEASEQQLGKSVDAVEEPAHEIIILDDEESVPVAIDHEADSDSQLLAVRYVGKKEGKIVYKYFVHADSSPSGAHEWITEAAWIREFGKTWPISVARTAFCAVNGYPSKTRKVIASEEGADILAGDKENDPAM